MNEVKRSGQLGKGMKPRGNQQLTEEKQAEIEQAVSTDEGQPEGVNEPVLETNAAVEGAEIRGDLDYRKVQILDSEKAEMVAEPSGFSPILPEIAELQKALQDSAEKMTGAVDGFQAKAEAEHPRIYVPPINHQELEASLERLYPGKIMVTPAQDGLQADGTLRVSITIAEEYVEGVRQAAEADNRTVEEWCSEQFGFYLEGYYSPSQAR